MLKKLSLTLLMVLSFALVGCDKTPPEVELTDQEIVNAIKDELSFTDTEVSNNVTLPTTDNEDVTLEWTSSNTGVMDVDGTITRPDAETGNKNVSLTVTITLNEAVATKFFDFTILATAVDTTLDTRYTDDLSLDVRSEERRVGKEVYTWWATCP